MCSTVLGREACVCKYTRMSVPGDCHLSDYCGVEVSEEGQEETIQRVFFFTAQGDEFRRKQCQQMHISGKMMATYGSTA